MQIQSFFSPGYECYEKDVRNYYASFNGFKNWVEKSGEKDVTMQSCSTGWGRGGRGPCKIWAVKGPRTTSLEYS